MSDIAKLITLVSEVSLWFAKEGWNIETAEDGRALAVMSSGYGSGPAVIDIADLTKCIWKAMKE